MSQAAVGGADAFDASVRTSETQPSTRPAVTAEQVAYLRAVVEGLEHSVAATERAIADLQDSLEGRRAELDAAHAELDAALGEPQGEQHTGEGDA